MIDEFIYFAARTRDYSKKITNSISSLQLLAKTIAIETSENVQKQIFYILSLNFIQLILLYNPEQTLQKGKSILSPSEGNQYVLRFSE